MQLREKNLFMLQTNKKQQCIPKQILHEQKQKQQLKETVSHPRRKRS